MTQHAHTQHDNDIVIAPPVMPHNLSLVLWSTSQTAMREKATENMDKHMRETATFDDMLARTDCQRRRTNGESGVSRWCVVHRSADCAKQQWRKQSAQFKPARALQAIAAISAIAVISVCFRCRAARTFCCSERWRSDHWAGDCSRAGPGYCPTWRGARQRCFPPPAVGPSPLH